MYWQSRGRADLHTSDMKISCISLYKRYVTSSGGWQLWRAGFSREELSLLIQKWANTAAEGTIWIETTTEISWLKIAMMKRLLWQIKSTVLSAAWVWFTESYETQNEIPSSCFVTLYAGIRLINRKFPFFQHAEIIIPQGYDLLLRYSYTFTSRPSWKELEGRLYSSNIVVKPWSLLQAPK